MNKDFMEFIKTSEPFEVKEEGFIEGYASVFGKVDAYGDTILPTAYDDVLTKSIKPLMAFNHDIWDLPVGKWTDLSKDDYGLKVKGQLNLALDKGREIYEALKFGSLDGLSVRIGCRSEGLEFTEDGYRIIKSVYKLPEISIVGLPADDYARITSVKMDEIETIKDYERYLRDAGKFSRKDAVALVATAKRVLSQSDSGDELATIASRIDAINKSFRGN